MKTILMSVKPKWMSMILNGVKTVELRKTRPQIQPPFRVLLYCSAKNTRDPMQILEYHDTSGHIHKLNGTVAAWCVCDYIKRQEDFTPVELTQCRVSRKEIRQYQGTGTVWGWHLTDLHILRCPVSLDRITGRKAPQSWEYLTEAAELKGIEF